MIRPRGPFGVLRNRGPLSLVLYVAGLDGLLVWRGPESLAVLQPPGDRPRPTWVRGLRSVAVHHLARSWDTMIFVVPPVVLMLLAAGAAVLVAVEVAWAAWAGVLLVMAALLHITVLLVCGVLSGLWWFFREFGRPAPVGEALAAELLPGTQWTVVFCHHVDREPPKQLLRDVRRRLDRILQTDVEEAAVELGIRVTGAAVTDSLLWLRRGATTEELREIIADSNFMIRASDYRPVRQPLRLFDRGGFLFWFLAGEAVVIIVLARFVPGWERAACGSSCTGHPVTYADAAQWLVQRLLLTDPYGLGPASRMAWLVGWLVSVMSLMGGVVAVVALRQYSRVRRAELAAAIRKAKKLNDHTRTLLMVATREEREAVLAAARAVTGHEPQPTFPGNQTVWQLGRISATQLMLVQVEPGAIGPGAAAITAAALVSNLDLDFFLLVGICYGLRPGPQKYGDILVCDQLRAIGHNKVVEPPGTPAASAPESGAEAAATIRDSPSPQGSRTVYVRGDYVTPSVALLGRFRAFEHQWNQPPAVYFGPMLSHSTLVNSRSLRDELAAQHPDAIGGEMEGAGVYAAAAHAKVDWIVIKAICDWGFAKDDRAHEKAARNAAEFVVRAAQANFLDEAPKRAAL